MYHDADGPILPEDFIDTLLLSIAEEVDAARRDQPDYRAFEALRARWNDALSGLDSSLFQEYDTAVSGAFSVYQETLENCSVVKGLTDALRRQREDGEDAVPGLEEAERQLRQACRQFTARLDGGTAALCTQYLDTRKALIDAGRALCERCGAELAEGLLERSGS